MISRRFTDFLARLKRAATDRERERLTAILGLNRVIAATGDRRALLQRVVDEAVATFGAERGFLIAATDDGFRVELARSLDREPVRQPERKLSSTVVRQCLRDGAGRFVEDAQADDELSAAQSVADLELRSVLCMPLTAGDRRIGCIYLDHRFRSGVFRREDLPWFEAFADQAAIAVHLLQLLAEVEARSVETERENRELAARVADQARELTELKDGLGREHLRHAYPAFVGEAPALLRCLHLLDRVADGSYPVLLVGESGCGKELAARAIHDHGPRRAGPFVAVNVAAISPALLESELFGHVKGAFTGAERDRRGLIAEAAGGTLFLDEATEMPLELQAKLLRVLEERAVRPVGADTTVPVDVRVVAATNRSPAAAVRDGALREDLYYRLAVVTVELPPLRERRSDVPLLVDHFLAEAARSRGGEPRTATPALCAALARRSWPGNVRQLRNEVFRLDALAHGDEIDAGALQPEEVAPSARSLDLAELERWAIAEALRQTAGNKAEAARLLGISRRALYNKLERQGGG